MPIAPPPVDSERYIRAECSTTTHSSLPPCPALQSPLKHPYLADMKLSGILILLVILCLLGDSVDGLRIRRTCPPGKVLRKVCIFRRNRGRLVRVCVKKCVRKHMTTTAATTTMMPEMTTQVRNVLYMFVRRIIRLVVHAVSEGGVLTAASPGACNIRIKHVGESYAVRIKTSLVILSGHRKLI